MFLSDTIGCQPISDVSRAMLQNGELPSSVVTPRLDYLKKKSVGRSSCDESFLVSIACPDRHNNYANHICFKGYLILLKRV